MMKKILALYFSPQRLFSQLKEKPEWVIPFIVVLVVASVVATLTIALTRDSLMPDQIEALKQRGTTDEQIEQFMKIARGPIPLVSAAVFAPLTIAALLVIFALVTNLLIPVFGGKSLFKNVFSVVSFSALVRVPASALKIILTAFAGTSQVATSLAMFTPNLAKNSFTYQLLNGFDFFVIWEVILVALGLSITNELKKQNAYILVFLIWIASVLIGAGLAGLTATRT